MRVGCEDYISQFLCVYALDFFFFSPPLISQWFKVVGREFFWGHAGFQYCITQSLCVYNLIFFVSLLISQRSTSVGREYFGAIFA